MSEPQPVQPGQVWADNDPRANGRRVRIVSVDATHATVEVTAGRWGSAPTVGRTSRISLGRFKPTSTGYRLVTNADGSAA